MTFHLDLDTLGERAAPFDARGPCVHAIMVTGKSPARNGLAQMSVVSFLEQDYLHRKLVIVTDGEELVVSGTAARWVEVLRVPPGRSLGLLRNEGLCAVPLGSVWVQWDDDDWHDSRAMREQLEVLQGSGAHAVTLRSQIRHAFGQDVSWVDRLPARAHGFAGTIMAMRSDGPWYPDLRLGEDSRFLEDFLRMRRVEVWDNPPDRYLRLIHGQNSWDETHFGLHRLPRGRRLVPEEVRERLEAVLARYAPVVQGGSEHGTG